MKKAFEEAAELFRHCEAAVAAPDRDQAVFFHGLALLAEGLNKLEKRFEQIESEAQSLNNGRLKDNRRVARRIILAGNHQNSR